MKGSDKLDVFRTMIKNLRSKRALTDMSNEEYLNEKRELVNAIIGLSI
jgi:hypothetical protein